MRANGPAVGTETSEQGRQLRIHESEGCQSRFAAHAATNRPKCEQGLVRRSLAVGSPSPQSAEPDSQIVRIHSARLYEQPIDEAPVFQRLRSSFWRYSNRCQHPQHPVAVRTETLDDCRASLGGACAPAGHDLPVNVHTGVLGQWTSRRKALRGSAPARGTDVTRVREMQPDRMHEPRVLDRVQPR